MEIVSDITAYVGCIAGAISIDDYGRGLTDAGFSEVHIVDLKADLNAYAQIENQSVCFLERRMFCCGFASHNAEAKAVDVN